MQFMHRVFCDACVQVRDAVVDAKRFWLQAKSNEGLNIREATLALWRFYPAEYFSEVLLTTMCVPPDQC